MKQDKAFCSGCGLCISVCPVDNVISIFRQDNGLYSRTIDSTCIECGKCRADCFFTNLDYGLDEEYPLGQLISAYLVYSTNRNTRAKAASGGAITEFLRYLLNGKFVDSIIVSKIIKEGNHFVNRPQLVNDASILNEFQGSHYIPGTLHEVVRQVIDDESVKKVAFVGLPC